jgi:hypothetical protein
MRRLQLVKLFIVFVAAQPFWRGGFAIPAFRKKPVLLQ